MARSGRPSNAPECEPGRSGSWGRIALAVIGAAIASTSAAAQTLTPVLADDSPEPYRDQYLVDGEGSTETADDFAIVEPIGQRRVTAETIYYSSSDGLLGDEVERGARANWRRETLNWGVVDAQVQIANFDSDLFGRASGSDAVVTLRQSSMPVSADTMLDTVVGHQRTRLDSLLHGGYRYRLPTSPLFGVTTALNGAGYDVRLSTGNVGAYRGVALPRFEETGGRLTSIGYDQEIGPQLRFGSELVHVTKDDDVRDHTSFLAGTRYTLPNNRHDLAARLLADDDGNIGIWTDSRLQLESNPVLRYGMFRFGRDLVFTDVPIADDQWGAYLRADINTFRYNLSTGYDYTEMGSGSTTATSNRSHSVFASGSVRLSRSISIGFNEDVATRDFEGPRSDQQLLWRSDVFGQLSMPLGTLRLEAFWHRLTGDIEANERKRSGLRTSFDWRMPEKVRLTSELRFEEDDKASGRARWNELGMLFRYDILRNVSLGLNATLFQTRSDFGIGDDGIVLNADVRWLFLRNWYATLSLNDNRRELNVQDIGFFGQDRVDGTRAFWITVGYARSAGQPYPTFGRAHDGKAGSGAISGLVFFDENHDSIRQFGEKVAIGATVVLDGRYETRTDELGRFQFAPVPTGAHEITVLTEELPLPWGLEDETPRRINVPFRGAAEIDFALTVMD